LEIPFDKDNIASIVERLDKLEAERQRLIKSKESQEKMQLDIINIEITKY
jgi:hypothetical protein